MKKYSFGNALIRIGVAISLTYAPLLQAQSATPPTAPSLQPELQTADGGGGKQPPKDPRPFKDPGGAADSNNNGKANKPDLKLDDSSPAPPGMTGLKTEDGKDIYYMTKNDPATGKPRILLDSAGRPLVWSFRTSATGYSYRYGVLDDTFMVKWDPEKSKSDYTPIPRDRGLVVVDTHQSGQSDVNSYGERTDLWDARPSAIARTLDRLSQGTADAQESFKQFLAGDKVTAAKGVGLGVGTFYVGLGIIAAYQLYYDYPNNPTMWDQYAAQLTNPVQILMLTGFMAVAYPFLSKVGSLSSLGKTIRVIPAFAAGMVVGTISQGMLYYVTDPDWRKCTGVANYREGFKQDLAACDKVFGADSSAAESITYAWGPAFAELLSASGLFLFSQYALTASGVLAWIESLPWLAGMKANLVTMTIGTTIFLASYAASKHYLNLTKTGHDFLLGYYSPFGSIYGGALPQSEHNLYTGWTELKKNGFIDRAAPTNDGVSPECQAEMDAGAGGDSCVTKIGPLDFAGVLKHYGNLQSRWRADQLSPTVEAYHQWSSKVQGYHQTLNASHDMYADFVDRIKSGATDSKGFNQTAITALEKVYADGGTAAFTTQKTDHVWRWVQTPNFLDFAVASMACGPEAEGYTPQTGIWSSAVELENKVSRYLPGTYTNPRSVIDNVKGEAINFYPPRLVKHVAGSDGTVCDTSPMPHIWTPMQSDDSYAFLPGMFAISGAHWYSAPSYKNLYDFIKGNIREDVLAGDKNQFDDWWMKNVGPKVYDTELQLRSDYQDLLDKSYVPALTRQDYQWRDVSTDIDPVLAGYLTQLEATQPDALHRNAFGVWPSLGDELRLYLAMLIDAEVTGQAPADATAKKQLEDGLINDAQAITKGFDALGAQLAQSNPLLRGDVNQSGDLTGQAFATLREKLKTLNGGAVTDQSPAYQKQVQTLMDMAKGLIAQSSNFYSILTAFDSALEADSQGGDSGH